MRSEGPEYIGKLVEFERAKIDSFKIRGFVLAVSDELTMLSLLTDDYFLNGFTIIRNTDVTAYWIFDRDTLFVSRVLLLKGIRPKALPKIDITNWHRALVTAQRRFPLLTIHPEARNPEICYIGRIVSITEKTVTFHEIDTVAEWEGKRRHRLGEITRLDFGGGYEDALWRVAVADGVVPAIGI